jgi:2Fe-2S ferredoxin
MTTIVFVESGGAERAVEAVDGASLMSAAVSNRVDGILADCGGACSCATCHVHVDPAWIERIGPPSDLEASMLEFAEELQATSRLSCQIRVRPDLDGLIVRVPQAQG